jgi:NADPH-dependent ferric siderophore reductase
MLTYVDRSVERDNRAAYRPFRARVARIARVSESYYRVTFAGDDFALFASHGLDQRVKILFPIPGIGLTDVGLDGEWYARWRALPDAIRNPLRTYTVRSIRQQQRELDVDFVSHGDGGPAALWLLSAKVGDSVAIVGPDALSLQSTMGIDWHPGSATDVLLAADETAMPAVCGILESLPDGKHATAFIEVPFASDACVIDSRADVSITWLCRDSTSVRLESAIRHWLAEHEDQLALARGTQELDDVDVETTTLWESPEAGDGSFYAWLAGESAVIKRLRRLLVTETGVDRSRVAFMGYWRLGKSELQ